MSRFFVGDITSQNVLVVNNNQVANNNLEDDAVLFPFFDNPQILLQNVSHDS